MDQAMIKKDMLQESLERMLSDIGAAMSASLVLIGDRLGLYKTLAKEGPLTSHELADRTGCNERYVREWLNNQVAGGYVNHLKGSQSYMMTAEQSMLLAEESSDYFMPGAFEIIASTARDAPRIEQCFKTGEGMSWGEHDPSLFHGTERFFGHNYRANLISSWIPSLHGVEKRLKEGIDVADVGCGHGISTILMAKAFPKSRFVGYDNHTISIKTARERAKESGQMENLRFAVGSAQDYPGSYDLVTSFDCLHDMSDPLGAAVHTRQSLLPNGTWMIVEPRAGDDIEHNINPVGRVFYAASTMVCVPSGLQNHGPALGAQAGEKKIREVVSQGGFTQINRTAETPFNLVLEAKA